MSPISHLYCFYELNSFKQKLFLLIRNKKYVNSPQLIPFLDCIQYREYVQ